MIDINLIRYLVLLLVVGISTWLPSFTQTKDYQAEYAKGYRGGFIKNQESIDGALEFAVIGDWGRGGEYFQKDVAAVLAQAVTGVNANFIISTGDNIYPEGVASTKDPLWNMSFENVFYQYPLHRPWYVVLGNHDYAGNPQAQIDYSKISQRWKMPDRYYSIKRKIDNTNEALFIFLDTNPFNPDYYNSSNMKEKLVTQDTLKQKQWLEQTLQEAGPSVKWKIVVGHHPLYTAGNRAMEKPPVRNAFEKIFEKYKVDVYICGHEHHLQYTKPKDKYTHHFISGAGSEANESLKPRGDASFFAPIQGFMIFSLTSQKMLMQAIDRQGNLLTKVNIDHQNK